MKHNSLRNSLQKAPDDEAGIFAGYVVMTSYYPDKPDPVRVALPLGSPSPSPSYRSRYSDRSMSWRSRLFGVAGSTAIYTLVLGVALFTWRTVHSPVTSIAQPMTVIDLPLAAPPEPVRDVAPGPEQVEHQQAKPEPKLDVVVPPPMIQLVPPSAAPQKPSEPVEVIDPGPPVPETTAPKAVAAPSAARMSNNARPSWEGQVLAHLERFRRYPARARAAHEEGVTTIRFTMNRAGMVLSASIVGKSGSSTLDQAALETLKRAQPLPAIPPDKPDPVELTIPVEFFLSTGR